MNNATTARQQMIYSIYTSDANYAAEMEGSACHWTMPQLELLDDDTLAVIWELEADTSWANSKRQLWRSVINHHNGAKQ
jgi:hypothetical protein